MLFRVLGTLSIGSSGEAPSNLAVPAFTHIVVARREFSGGSCNSTMVKSEPVIGGNFKILYKLIQGLNDYLNYGFSELL